jgi:REP element-mobilizing transposase RayT
MRYFLTICTVDRQSGLTRKEIAASLYKAWDEIAEANDAEILCRTVMPNHVHVLLRLGKRLTLGQVVGKWKASTKAALKQEGLSWQRDFYERRLRPENEQEPFGLYVFMNPYRSGLVQLNEVWPWWRLDSPEAFRFPTLCKEGLYPQPEWAEQSSQWRRERGW